MPNDACGAGPALVWRRLDSRISFHGLFHPSEHQGAKYWYCDIPDGHGGTKRRCVGPADDPVLSQRVADHRRDKDDLRTRRHLVNTLTREGGMVAPDAMSGDIVEALAEGGLFRLRGVLIGTVAFQCYSGLLGMRLPMAAILTGDADFAQDYAISQEVADSLPPIVELLQGVDPSFRPVPIDQDLLLRPRSKTPGGDTGLSS